MRRLLPLTLAALTLAAFPLTCHHAGRWANPPRYGPGQKEALRKIATATVERYERLYGHLPPEEWPEQPRASYEAAKRYLAELDEAGGD